jgi:hypothetical protein
MKFFAGLSILAAVASALPYNNEVPTLLKARAGEVCVKPGRIVSIVIDSSGSNSDTDPNNLRLAGAKEIVNYLTPASKATANNKADVVAVVDFDTRARVDYALGDPTGAYGPIDSIDSVGGTDVAVGLRAGLAQVAKGGSATADRTGIVMFTDGLDSSKSDMLRALAQAKSQGVRVSWGHLYQPKVEQTKTHKGLLGWLWNWSSSSSSSSSGGPIDPDISAAVLKTGGTVSMIATPQAQLDFVAQVLKNGITNNDGKCSGLDIDEGGGPVVPDINTMGLCSNTASAVFTYSPKSTNENLDFAVELVSKSNPVQLKAVYLNKATGDTTTVIVNSGQAIGHLIGKAAPGQEVTLTVTPSGATDTQTCQYSVGLVAKPDTAPGTSTPPVVVPTTTATPPVVVPTTTATPPVVVPTTTATPPVVVPTTSACPTGPAGPAETIVQTVMNTVFSTVIQTVAGPTSTIVSTVVQTITGSAPTATASVCMCACTVPGAKPFPKFEL